jgi:hypothetical protein
MQPPARPAQVLEVPTQELHQPVGPPRHALVLLPSVPGSLRDPEFFFHSAIKKARSDAGLFERREVDVAHG